MIVGITVVGFGTSLPEFSVSVLAATRGSGGLSVGNAVGSNIMNLLLVLGVSSMLYPIRVVGDRRLVRRDLVFGLFPAVVLLVLAWDGSIGRGTAVILLVLFVAFMATCFRQGRDEARTRTIVAGGTGRHIAVAAVGTVVLVTGAELMVRGGVSVALSFGISEAVIGLTLVASFMPVMMRFPRRATSGLSQTGRSSEPRIRSRQSGDTSSSIWSRKTGSAKLTCTLP